jgi:mono/diheme cytochrome c family protein
MPLWHLKDREVRGYLWDRSNTSLQEVVRASAVLEGASPRWMDVDTVMWDRTSPRQPSSLRRVMEYLTDLTPPKYPFAVDAALAAAGAATYTANCASCHDANGARAGAPIPLGEIGTDRARADAWFERSAEALNAYGEGHDWKFSRFRKSPSGYVAPPLDGVWLNAPYLHNGSVPTLADLLEAPADRPRQFWRGYDVYDQTRGGFVSDGADARRLGTPLDVAQPGNGNGGHTYGTTLPANEKRALLEYLKTR